MYMHTYIHREVRECTPCTHKHTHVNTQHEEIHAWHVETHTHLNPTAFHPYRQQQRDEACSKWPCACPSAVVAGAIEPGEGVQTAHQWMREVEQSLGRSSKPPVAPTQTHHTQLPGYLSRSESHACFISGKDAMSWAPCQVFYTPHLSLFSQQPRRRAVNSVWLQPAPSTAQAAFAPSEPWTQIAPKGGHVAQLCSSPAAEYTSAHAAGPWAAWSPHLQQLLPPPGCAFLGPTPWPEQKRMLPVAAASYFQKNFKKVFPSGHGDYLRFNGVSSYSRPPPPCLDPSLFQRMCTSVL